MQCNRKHNSYGYYGQFKVLKYYVENKEAALSVAKNMTQFHVTTLTASDFIRKIGQAT
jgi:hypothetical protein